MKFTEKKHRTSTLNYKDSTDSYILISIIFVISIFYIDGFSNNFLDGFDDDWLLYQFDLVQEFNFQNLYKIWTNDTPDMYYLPVTFTSFAIDVAIFGNDAYWMKVENLFLFIISGGLLYYLFNMLKVNPWLSLCTIMLFLVHPMQIESIGISTGRRQILCILFLVISVIGSYKYLIDRRNWVWCVIAILSFILSIGSKPTSFVFLPFMLAVIFLEAYWWKNISLEKRRVFNLMFPMLLMTILFLYLNIQAGERNFLRQEFDYTLFQHVLIILSSFGIYLKKFFIGPYIIYHPISPSESFDYVYYIVFSGIFVMMLGIMIYGLIKANRILLYGLLWYILALVPSGVLLIFASDYPMNTSDRYFMLAAPGLVLVIVYVINFFSKKILFVISSGLLFYFIILSINQLNYVSSSIDLLNHNNEVFPTKDMMYKLTSIYSEREEKDKALEVLLHSQKLEVEETLPHVFFTYVELSKLLIDSGNERLANEMIYKSLSRDLEGFEELTAEELDKLNLGEIYSNDHLDECYKKYYLKREDIIKTYHLKKKPYRI